MTGAGFGNWTSVVNQSIPPVVGYQFVPLLGWDVKLGFFSIGAKKYDSNYGAVWRVTNAKKNLPTRLYPSDIFPREKPGDYESPFLKTHCPFRYDRRVLDFLDPCDFGNTFEMKMYAVKQKGMDGVERALAGWVHIELKLLDPTDEIRIIYLQMRDEFFNAIGEFVMDPAEQCPSNDEDVFVSPTNKQFLPCTATGLRETAPSQALYMVSREILLDETAKDPANGYIPEGDFKRGIHVTWRLGDAFIITKRMIQKREKTLEEIPSIYQYPGDHLQPNYDYPRYLRKIPDYWLRADWFGAHDIKSGPGPLECNELILDDTGNPTGAAPSSLENDYLNPKYYYLGAKNTYFYQSCQVDPQNVKPEDAVVLEGRCVHLFKTVENNGDTYMPLHPSINKLHNCTRNTTAPEFLGVNFESYKNYTAMVQTARNRTCNTPCRPPVVNTSDVDDIKAFNVSGTTGLTLNKTESSHTERTTDSLAKFWRGRKFHGILCIICTMFVTPVSLFAARYFKETVMKHVFAGLQIWYWIHVANSLGLFAIYFSSQMAIRPSISSWGHSEDAFATSHYILGWISHTIFTLMLVFGGVRGGTHGSAVKVRKMIMTAHAFVGFAQYWINLLLVLISTWIPASPTADACGENGLPTGVSAVAILTITWAAVDIMFHGAIMFIQISGDTKLGFKRPWYLPIVPILPSDSTNDMDGSFLRQIVFLVYLGISGTFTFSTILTLGLSAQVPGCVFGEMTCKSPLGCSSAALSMCRNLKYSNCDG
ncbi:hypothetical protein Ocin01_17528, partial [Orchesella cincta]